MSYLDEFEKVKVCIGERTTPSYNTHYGKSIPKSVIVTQDENLIDTYLPNPKIKTHSADMSLILQSFLLKEEYANACAAESTSWNKQNPDKMKQPKAFAKAIFSSPDFRRAKTEVYLDENLEIRSCITNDSYKYWTGFQPFDIDFCDDINSLETNFDKTRLAKELKPLLFNKLKQYNWLMLVTESTGGHGVHIYTANNIPIYFTTEQKKTLFENLYQYKALCIYKALYDIYKDRYPVDIIIKLLDAAMYKPEQPLYISVTDNSPLINEDFIFSLPDQLITEQSKNNIYYVRRTDEGEFFPKKEGKYNELYNHFWENPTFIKPLPFNYDYIKQEKLKYIPNSAEFDNNLSNGKWTKEKFYFGFRLRHDGIPTLWEICKYLLQSRGYEESLRILNSEIYKKPELDQNTCTTRIVSILNTIHHNNWNLRVSPYVYNWVKENLLFEDTEYREKLTLNSFELMPYMVLDVKGKVLPIQANYETYFNKSKSFSNKLKYNDFEKIQEFDDRPFTDETIAYINNSIRRDFPPLSNTKIIKDVITEICSSNKYNPLLDKLNSLKWDNVKRAETVFIDYLGVDDLPIIREMTRKILYGAVLRALHPGCQFDLVLVLYGGQGIGKTIFLRRLGFEKYTKTLSIGQFGLSKDDVQKMQKGWIINLDELVGLKKASIEKLKSDITETEDNERFAFKEFNGNYKRKVIFVATTNDKEFINDVAGTDGGASRRWCPMECKQTDKEYVFKNFTPYIAEQVWAEVMQWYKDGYNEPLYIKSDDFDEYQDQFSSTSIDVACDWVLDILNQKYLLNENGEIPSLGLFQDYYIHGKDNPNISLNGQLLDKIPFQWVRALLQSCCRETRSGNAILKGLKGKFYKRYMDYNGEKQACLVRKTV